MKKAKKLKDLRKGDPIWLYDFTWTTPIHVEKVKRQGSIAIVNIKWGNLECEAYGPALGRSCVAYIGPRFDDYVFTTDYELAKFRQNRNEGVRKYMEIGQAVEKMIGLIRDLKNDY